MPKLVVIRHGLSEWNRENRFTGWVDVDLSEKGVEEARRAGELLRGESFDVLFTSVLKRATRTAEIAMKRAGIEDLPTHRDSALNERHYGDLQGLNKEEMRQKHGADQVHTWRRSFNVRPPGEDGESLRMTIERVLPYYHREIEPMLLDGKNVLIVAHGNSLRALSYHLDGHTEESIVELEIPTGVPIVYDLALEDNRLHVVSRTVLR